MKTKLQPQSESVSASTGAAPAQSTPFQTTWTVFWVAFLVRVLYITLAHTYHLRTGQDHFEFGYEMGRVAQALATGHGYADPFIGHTGPTTWVPPLYPLLLAGVFKLFGVYTLRSAWVILTINSFFSALTTLTTYEIAARCFNRRVALWSAWIWALYPAAMQYAVRWVWDMTLSTWLLSLILVLALRMRRIGEISFPADPSSSHNPGRTLRRWVIFGVLWGVLALSNPSLLLFLPACGLWVLHGTGHWRRQAGYASISALVFILCISPWTIRNALAFHRFIPMRANFGAELYLGNGPGAMGFLMEYNHPYEAPDQLRLYKQMGEVEYAQMRGRLAKKYIENHPGLFFRNSLKRLYFFWVSVPHPTGDAWFIEPVRVTNFAFASLAGLLGLALALKRRMPAAWLFAWAFLLIPLIYYFVTVHARFRNPLEPLIAILAVYLFQSAEKRWPRWIRSDSTVDGPSGNQYS
ncbi:MAG TPA: glycosyltransferase family 39 protein [Acidobacteriaceae bacterium]|nr:glycosyltransferase family 39 protein [Acidobacteriaceae bacterium]